jgi:glycosyltransferase involved in cell wall biosynthesis
MISVLIPVYNTDVFPLISELSRQLNNLHIRGEIIVFDDSSSSAYRHLNKPIINLPQVVYKELHQNHGRTAIRQLLGEAASYEWLLFLDNDSGILRPDFLEKYIVALTKGYDAYVGGTSYPAKVAECDKKLHWKYGINREAVKGNKTAFHTNNFCIRKEVFVQLNFPNFLKQYGHEDTWMGMELERIGRKICRINNPVEHLNIENTSIFLDKTQQALQNLLLLESVTEKKRLLEQVPMFRLYHQIKQFHLAFAVTFIYSSAKKKILRNLHSCNPSLLAFDFYRLYHIIRLSNTSVH